MKDWLKLAISVLLPLLAGFVGGLFTSSSVSTWYLTLNKPFFNPPDWVFGPVWTLLYILMGLSFYLVWVNKKKNNLALSIFGIQLFLNLLWSVLFFGLRNPLFAFIEIIFLWAAILCAIILFYRIDKNASYLLIPYILWVSFAAVLNLYLVVLN